MTRLPPLDDQLIADAVAAYRMAVEYVLHIEDKWAERGAELRKLDEFHRTRVTWENDSHRAERLYARSVHFLKAAARGGGHVFVDRFDDAHVFPRCRERLFVKTLKAVNDVKARMDAALTATLT